MLRSFPLPAEVARQLAESMMNERQRAEFGKELECNFAISIPGLSRFRVNVLFQQQNVGMVMRTIPAEIPDFDTLGLPEILKDVEERRSQLLMDLSAHLRAIVSQLLVRTVDGKGRRAAIEILINTPTIAERIFKGEFHELKDIMGKSREFGMRTFDWALFELYNGKRALDRRRELEDRELAQLQIDKSLRFEAAERPAATAQP